MVKIVLTGPESTGKTDMAKLLAEHYSALWVPEFARSYIGSLNRPYIREDLLEIARGQIALEDHFMKNGDNLLFFDTSLEVIKVWSDYRFGAVDPWITGRLQSRRHDLYLLCHPDLPWVFDAQRENPTDRDVLFEIYRQELQALGVRFSELQGSGEKRLLNALEIVNKFLKNESQ